MEIEGNNKVRQQDSGFTKPQTKAPKIKGRQAKRREKKQKFDTSSESENDENSSVATSASRQTRSSRAGDEESGRFAKHLTTVFNVSNRLLPKKVLTHWSDEKGDTGKDGGALSWQSWTIPISVSTVSLSSFVGNQNSNNNSEPFVEKQLKSFLDDDDDGDDDDVANNHDSSVPLPLKGSSEDSQKSVQSDDHSNELRISSNIPSSSSSQQIDVQSQENKEETPKNSSSISNELEICNKDNSDTEVQLKNYSEIKPVNESFKSVKNVEKEEFFNKLEQENVQQQTFNELPVEERSAKNIFDKTIVNSDDNSGDIVSNLGSWFSGIKKVTQVAASSTIPSAVKFLAENASNIIDTVVSDFPPEEKESSALRQKTADRKPETETKNAWNDDDNCWDDWEDKRQSNSKKDKEFDGWNEDWGDNDDGKEIAVEKVNIQDKNILSIKNDDDSQDVDGWDGDWGDDDIDIEVQDSKAPMMNSDSTSKIEKMKEQETSQVQDDWGGDWGDGDDDIHVEVEASKGPMMNSHSESKMEIKKKQETSQVQDDWGGDWGDDDIDIEVENSKGPMMDSHSESKVETKKKQETSQVQDDWGGDWGDDDIDIEVEDSKSPMMDSDSTTKIETMKEQEKSQVQDDWGGDWGDGDDDVQVDDSVLEKNIETKNVEEKNIETKNVKEENVEEKNVEEEIVEEKNAFIPKDDSQQDGWDGDWEVDNDDDNQNIDKQDEVDEALTYIEEKIEEKIKEKQEIQKPLDHCNEERNDDSLPEDNIPKISSSVQVEVENKIELNVQESEKIGWNDDWNDEPDVDIGDDKEEEKEKNTVENETQKISLNVEHEQASEIVPEVSELVDKDDDNAWNDWGEESPILEEEEEEVPQESESIVQEKDDSESRNLNVEIDVSGSNMKDNDNENNKIETTTNEQQKENENDDEKLCSEIEKIEYYSKTEQTEKGSKRKSEKDKKQSALDNKKTKIEIDDKSIQKKTELPANDKSQCQTESIQYPVECFTTTVDVGLMSQDQMPEPEVGEFVQSDVQPSAPEADEVFDNQSSAEVELNSVNFYNNEQSNIINECSFNYENKPKIDTEFNNEMEQNYNIPTLDDDAQQATKFDEIDLNDNQNINQIQNSNQNSMLPTETVLIPENPVIHVPSQAYYQPVQQQQQQNILVEQNPQHDILHGQQQQQQQNILVEQNPQHDILHGQQQQQQQNILLEQNPQHDILQGQQQQQQQNILVEQNPQHDILQGQQQQQQNEFLQEYSQQQNEFLQHETSRMGQQQTCMTPEEYEAQQRAWQEYYLQYYHNHHQPTNNSNNDDPSQMNPVEQQNDIALQNYYQNLQMQQIIQEQQQPHNILQQHHQQNVSQEQQQDQQQEPQQSNQQNILPVYQAYYNNDQQNLQQQPQNIQEYSEQKDYQQYADYQQQVMNYSQYQQNAYYSSGQQQQQPELYRQTPTYSTSSFNSDRAQAPSSQFSSSQIQFQQQQQQQQQQRHHEPGEFSISIQAPISAASPTSTTSLPADSNLDLTMNASQYPQYGYNIAYQQNFDNQSSVSMPAVVQEQQTFPEQQNCSVSHSKADSVSIPETLPFQHENVLKHETIVDNISNELISANQKEKKLEEIHYLPEVVEPEIVSKTWPECSEKDGNIPTISFPEISPESPSDSKSPVPETKVEKNIEKVVDDSWGNDWNDDEEVVVSSEKFLSDEKKESVKESTKEIVQEPSKELTEEIKEPVIVKKSWPECSQDDNIPKQQGPDSTPIQADSWGNDWNDDEEVVVSSEKFFSDEKKESVKESTKEIVQESSKELTEEIKEPVIVKKSWPECSQDDDKKNEDDNIPKQQEPDSAPIQDDSWGNDWNDDEEVILPTRKEDKSDNKKNTLPEKEETIEEPLIVKKSWPECSEDNDKKDDNIAKQVSSLNVLDSTPIQDDSWGEDWNDDEEVILPTKKEAKSDDKKNTLPEKEETIKEPVIVKKSWPECSEDNQKKKKNKEDDGWNEDFNWGDDEVEGVPQETKTESPKDVNIKPVELKKSEDKKDNDGWDDWNDEDDVGKEEAKKDEKIQKKLQTNVVKESEIISKKWPECGEDDNDKKDDKDGWGSDDWGKDDDDNNDDDDKNIKIKKISESSSFSSKPKDESITKIHIPPFAQTIMNEQQKNQSHDHESSKLSSKDSLSVTPGEDLWADDDWGEENILSVNDEHEKIFIPQNLECSKDDVVEKKKTEDKKDDMKGTDFDWKDDHWGIDEDAVLNKIIQDSIVDDGSSKSAMDDKKIPKSVQKTDSGSIVEEPIIQPKKWPVCDEDDVGVSSKNASKFVPKIKENKKQMKKKNDDEFDWGDVSFDDDSKPEIKETKIVPKKWPECGEDDGNDKDFKKTITVSDKKQIKTKEPLKIVSKAESKSTFDDWKDDSWDTAEKFPTKPNPTLRKGPLMKTAPRSRMSSGDSMTSSSSKMSFGKPKFKIADDWSNDANWDDFESISQTRSPMTSKPTKKTAETKKTPDWGDDWNAEWETAKPKKTAAGTSGSGRISASSSISNVSLHDNPKPAPYPNMFDQRSGTSGFGTSTVQGSGTQSSLTNNPSKYLEQQRRLSSSSSSSSWFTDFSEAARRAASTSIDHASNRWSLGGVLNSVVDNISSVVGVPSAEDIARTMRETKRGNKPR